MKQRRFLRSFQFQLISVTIIFLVIAISLPTALNAYYYINNMQKQNVKNSAARFADIEVQLEKILHDAQVATYNIGNIDAVYQYFMNRFTTDLEEIEAKQAFIQAIKETNSQYSVLDSLIFIRPDGTIGGSSSYRRYFYGGQTHPFFNTEEYLRVTKSNDCIWLGYYPRSYFTENASSQNSSTDYQIWGAKNIHYSFSDGSEPVDIVALFSISSKIVNDFLKYAQDSNGYVCLLDSNGRNLAGDKTVSLGNVPVYFSGITNEKFASIHYKDNIGDKHQVIFKRFDKTGWFLIKNTPMWMFKNSILPLWIFSIGVGAITLLLISLLYTIWAKRISRPLIQMSDVLRQVAENDMDVRIEIVGSESNEILLMKEQFNQMLNSIDALILQKKSDEKEKLRLEMNSLQAQIAPHFLYNTITSIRWLATINGANQVADMLVILINLLRPVFSSWATDWTVSEELAYIDNYMKLMRFRYGNMVTFQIDNQLEDETTQLPRFILQPLLENCFAHSMKGDIILNIDIKLYQENEAIIIRIYDDGVGISVDKLAQMNKMLTEMNSASEQPVSSIGLANVNRRIKLFSGPEYGIHLESEIEKGTCVTVKISNKLNETEKKL